MNNYPNSQSNNQSQLNYQNPNIQYPYPQPGVQPYPYPQGMPNQYQQQQFQNGLPPNSQNQLPVNQPSPNPSQGSVLHPDLPFAPPPFEALPPVSGDYSNSQLPDPSPNPYLAIDNQTPGQPSYPNQAPPSYGQYPYQNSPTQYPYQPPNSQGQYPYQPPNSQGHYPYQNSPGQSPYQHSQEQSPYQSPYPNQFPLQPPNSCSPYLPGAPAPYNQSPYQQPISTTPSYPSTGPTPNPYPQPYAGAVNPTGLVDGPCTYNQTHKKMVVQPFYNCRTCGLVDSLGCCEACSRICHAGHDVRFKGNVSCYCDCGHGKTRTCIPCNCRKVPAGQPTQPSSNDLASNPPCTYLQTGQDMVKQRLYVCSTCNFHNGECICDNCARVCHAGHDLRVLDEKGFCDCGAGSLPIPCKCIYSNPSLQAVNPSFIPGPCTFNQTGKKYMDQPFYRCITCGLVEPNGCCQQCASICHQGHQLVPAGILSSFCDCGSGECSGCPICKCVIIPNPNH